MSVENRAFENEFTNGGTTFTSTGEDLAFGFTARKLRLRNDAAKSIYFTLKSTTGATTSCPELKSSEEVFFAGDLAVSGMSYVATSSGGSLRVQAWGG